MKIKLSLVLATLVLGFAGCGSSDDDSSTDVTVERGKVYDAVVKDSSSPAQVATQKDGENVYTFKNEPTYPVVVTGGWIDVNNNGTMDSEDIKLDIEMKSYTTNVTPVTTYIADDSEEARDAKLKALVEKLNENGVGEDTKISEEDLLKVPSEAPQDVAVLANAVFMDMKETNKSTDLDVDSVMNKFSAINSAIPDGVKAEDIEKVVITILESSNIPVARPTQAEIEAFLSAHSSNEDVQKDVTAVVEKEDLQETQEKVEETVDQDKVELPSLDDYTTVLIYKNINKETADAMLQAYSSNNDFNSQEVSASCTDFGFTADELVSETQNEAGKVTTYINSTTLRSCAEADYAGVANIEGTSNILAYYKQ